MESLFFGPSSASLYGVYCPARPGRERPEGIVFCYPQGQEYMRAHRALRQLALNLADQGYHVLRFDYRGTGDSAGDMDGITLDHWVEDTQLAIAELRDMAALSRVALVGLRLGGTVAAEAACATTDVSRLVLWDPVCDGQAYIEELRTALPRVPAAGARSNFIDPDDTMHLNGFPLPLPLQQSVTARVLAKLDISGLQSILQLASHENPEFTALRQAWQANDVYEFRLEPAPHDWNYVDNFGSILLPQPIMTAIRSGSSRISGMRERAINIGQPVSLAGVMTEPEQAAAGKPVFIILNSGVMHHVGACRLSVKLARELANHAGITTIRFDFSGIGDSANRKHQASLEQAAGDEIREVIDYVEEKLGVDRVILCGLCSGAHNGFHAAVADHRVVGLVQYDGHCYPTLQSYLRFYAPRLLKWKHWRSVMRRVLGRLAGIGNSNHQAGPQSVDPRYVEQPLFAEKPPRAVMEDGLQQLVERKVRLLLVFTGADHLDFMYPQQYTDCFSSIDFDGLLQVEHFPHATHIVTEPHYQQQLLEHTRNWIMD